MVIYALNLHVMCASVASAGIFSVIFLPYRYYTLVEKSVSIYAQSVPKSSVLCHSSICAVCSVNINFEFLLFRCICNE
jgi:hypothetical protein